MKVRYLYLITIAAFTLSVTAAGNARAEEKKLEIKGNIQEMYRSVSSGITGNPESNSYSMRLARIGFSGKPSADWAYNFKIDASQQPALLDAYLDFSRENILPAPFAFTLRAGQFKVPFGLESITDDSTLDLINRSQVVNNLAPGRDVRAKGRDVGASLQVTAAPWGIKDFAQVTVGQFNGEGANATDRNNNKGLALRGVINPTKAVSWGVSYYNGNLYSTSTTVDRFGTELALTADRLYLKGEYVRGNAASIGNAAAKRAEGWYAQSGFFMLPLVLQAVAKYDIYDPDMNAAGDKIATTTAGLNWHFADGMRLQANYEWVYGESVGISCNVFSTVLGMNF